MSIFFKTYFDAMSDVKSGVYGVASSSEWRPALGTGLSGFWKRAKFSVGLAFREKEIITFAVLQWACVAAGYFLWVRMIGWIPPSVWHDVGRQHGSGIAGLILFVWSFVVVGVVAFPLGLLSGCMGAVHFLNRQGHESTIVRCLKIVLPEAWPIWIFQWIDGWWTVNRILDRLPKKNGGGSIEQVMAEPLYYAWKLATIGILPGLVTGRGLLDAGKRSVGLVHDRFADVAILRAGYSALCWIIGVGTYIGTIYFFIAFPRLVNFHAPVELGIFKFYFWAGVPMMAAVGAVMLFLHPVYVISSCDIYADYVTKRGENLMLPPPPGGTRWRSAAGAAVLLILLLAAVTLFRDRLGITGLLSR